MRILEDHICLIITEISVSLKLDDAYFRSFKRKFILLMLNKRCGFHKHREINKFSHIQISKLINY